jgi:hypothetical protein
MEIVAVVGAHVENTGLQPVHRLDVKHASALDNAGTVWEPLSHEQEPRLPHHCSSEVLLSALPERDRGMKMMPVLKYVWDRLVALVQGHFVGKVSGTGPGSHLWFRPS